jgi:phospholipase/carboxylesterase
MLTYEQRSAKADPQGLLILHHGRGTDERDLLPLADVLDPERRLHVVSPRAPLRLQGSPGFHWYIVPRVGYPDPDTFHSSYAQLAELHDHLAETTGLGPDRTILGGFSMGAVMSYALGLGPDRPAPAGIIPFSGFIPTVASWQPDLTRHDSTPLFITHGRLDPVIPIEFAHTARKTLQDAGFKVAYDEYDVGHQIDPRALDQARPWITTVLRR